MRFAPPGSADAQLVPLQGNSTPQTPNITVPSRVHDTRGPILELQNRDPDFQLLLPRKHLSQPPRKSGPVANALNDSATGAPRRRPCSNRYPHAIFYIKLQFQGCRKSPKRDGHIRILRCRITPERAKPTAHGPVAACTRTPKNAPERTPYTNKNAVPPGPLALQCPSGRAAGQVASATLRLSSQTVELRPDVSCRILMRDF